MEKKGLLLVGLIILLIIGGFVFTGCGNSGNNCPNQGDCRWITGAVSVCNDSACAVYKMKSPSNSTSCDCK